LYFGAFRLEIFIVLLLENQGLPKKGTLPAIYITKTFPGPNAASIPIDVFVSECHSPNHGAQ
jgi:hypothetical protein